MTEQSPDLAAAGGSPTVRVLIVDDHELFASSLELAFERTADLEVVGRAMNLTQAQAQVAATRPDVVVLDYKLPDGDGVAGTTILKEIAPEVRIVMLTASESEQVLVAAIEAGCSGFVTKTANIDELVSTVRTAAAGEVNISPMLLARLLPKLHRRERSLGSDLSPRELDVLRLLAQGMANAAIADGLGISVFTVRNHVQSVLAKLGVHSKLEALATAVREGLLDLDRG
ncbi:MAG TPA: response regulator transcription factor [Mycobacteriales bacterium]|nr:response regulator transcription factor [Mycobacteriales bacterium]